MLAVFIVFRDDLGPDAGISNSESDQVRGLDRVSSLNVKMRSCGSSIRCFQKVISSKGNSLVA